MLTFFQHRPWARAIGLGLLLFPLLCLAGDATSLTAPSLERIIWHKTPIVIALTVGEERLVHFPDAVSIGVPESMAPSLRSQSIHGTLYLLAHQPFESRRLLVRSDNQGPLYVLDVTATNPPPAGQPLSDVQILLPQAAKNTIAQDDTGSHFQAPGYVALTRFAAHQLYAPSRLLSTTPGIVRVPVSQAPVALVRGGQVQATPIAAWRAGRLTVTAVQLVNRSKTPVVLDPRQLRGHWLAATFQHNRLQATGSDAATTSVYLISDRAFALTL